MNGGETSRRLYWLTAFFGAAGAVAIWRAWDLRSGAGFALGAAGSLANLWFFHWLARGIAPGERTRKPWQAGAFASRYLLLFTGGYAIVKALNAKPLAVILGLFASTAAVLLWSAAELWQGRLGTRRTD